MNLEVGNSPIENLRIQMDGGAEVSGSLTFPAVTFPADKKAKPLSAQINLNPGESINTIQAKVHSDSQGFI